METISKCQNPPHLQDLLVPLAETHLQQVGQQNQGQDLNQNHHRNQKRPQKEKLVQEKNEVPLVRRKALDEKRHKDSIPFLFAAHVLLVFIGVYHNEESYQTLRPIPFIRNRMFCAKIGKRPSFDRKGKYVIGRINEIT